MWTAICKFKSMVLLMAKICSVLLMVADLEVTDILHCRIYRQKEERMIVSFAHNAELYVVFREALHLLMESLSCQRGDNQIRW
jgi:hypothetical protein